MRPIPEIFMFYRNILKDHLFDLLSVNIYSTKFWRIKKYKYLHNFLDVELLQYVKHILILLNYLCLRIILKREKFTEQKKKKKKLVVFI